MGSAPWKGDSLHSGSKLFIGGKEVELDTEISVSQLPDIEGIGLGFPNDEVGDEFISSNDFTKMETKKTFVTPANFYGIVKTKAKGPL